MKVLFCLLHFGYFRNFESVIRELARRGHHVHVAAEKADRDRAREMLERLAAEHPTVTLGTLPSREEDDYLLLVQRLRLGFDYLRYLEPAYRGMPGLLMRSEDRTPTGLLRLTSIPGMTSRPGRALVRAALRSLERAIPPSTQIEQYLLAERPDAVLISPLIGVVSSSQLDYLETACRLGIPTGFGVWSWDNLSSKALIRVMPDRVFVWNETQKDEAIQLHGIPSANVAITGAQGFDQWFGREPSRSREQFCRELGLPADRPYILYVGSTMVWKSPPEAEFVVRWLDHLRRSPNPALRNAAVLVRPHPARWDEWTHLDVSRFDHLAFSGGGTRSGTGAAFPIDADSRADYFDAIFHSAAVVGINTSAFIEAGIIGRPVLAVLADEFSGTQMGTIHFRYLTEVAGGLVRAGRAFDEHEAQLAEALEDGSAHEERNRRFLESFVRPHGLDRPATPIFADALESLGQLGRRPASSAVRPPLFSGIALRALATLTRRGRGKLLMMTKDERAAAAVTGLPEETWVDRAATRETKRFKRVHKSARQARKRYASRIRASLNRARKRTLALGRRVAGAARSGVTGRQPTRSLDPTRHHSASAGDCLIVSYHYVRDLRQSRFGRLNALSPIDFAAQLVTLTRCCEVIDPATFLNVVDTTHTLEAPSALLTFDDGLIDHYSTVFPAMRSHGLHGIFFVSPAGSRGRVLNVQKVQILLATLGGETLLREVESLTARAGVVAPMNRGHNELYRYDGEADRRVKQLLNYELPYATLDDVLATLFERHIGREDEIAAELYLTDDMIRQMSSEGMTFGFHTEHHRVLSRLSVDAQRAEIAGGVEWIRRLTGQATVPFCYPHGHALAYTAETVEVVRAAGYSMAFTAVRAFARPTSDARFELPRYDTRDVDAALAKRYPAFGGSEDPPYKYRAQ